MIEPHFYLKKREGWFFFAAKQEDMIFHGIPAKTPSSSRRRIMPPTQQQSPQPSLEGVSRHREVEDLEFGVFERESMR